MSRFEVLIQVKRDGASARREFVVNADGRHSVGTFAALLELAVKTVGKLRWPVVRG